MADFDIAYAYNPSTQTLAFEKKDGMSKLLVEKAINRMSQTANMFNVFGYMNITNNDKFKVTVMHALPIGLRACVPCTWDPHSSKVVRSIEIEPCCLEADEEFCPQEELNAIFTDIVSLEAKADGSVDMVKLDMFVSMIADLFADGISQAYNGVLAEGKVYDGVTVPFAAGVSTADQAFFPKTANACRGYARLFKDLSATYSWLNQSGIFVTTSGSETVNRDVYTGNPVDAVEALKAVAKSELTTAINNGFYMTRDGKQLRPVILCDVSFFNRVVNYYNETIGVMPLMVESPIKKETISGEFMGANGQKYNAPVTVYTIYGLPVVVDPNLNVFDVFKKAHLHFLAITVPQNIQLGTSLGKSALGVSEPPVKMEKSMRIIDKGKVYMTASMFAASALASENYTVASQLLVQWT